MQFFEKVAAYHEKKVFFCLKRAFQPVTAQYLMNLFIYQYEHEICLHHHPV